MRLDHYQTLIGSQIESDKRGISELSGAGLGVYGYRPDQDIRQLIADEPLHRAAVDSAVAHWSIDRHFPPRNAAVEYYSTKRFCAAFELLGSLAPSDIDVGAQESDFLRWLLVDYWHVSGYPIWLYRVTRT